MGIVNEILKMMPNDMRGSLYAELAPAVMEAMKPPKRYMYHVRYRTQRKAKYIVYQAFSCGQNIRDIIYDEIKEYRRKNPIWLESIECQEKN